MNSKSSLFSIQGRLSEFFRIMAAQTLKISISLADSDVQTFLEEEKTNKRKGKPKVTSMVLAMTFLAAENENRQLTYFSRVPEIFLPSVRNKSKPENFVY